MDQPLYALSKQIQWTWPETHGEEMFVLVMGGLHIENSALNLQGEWLDKSGWTSALIEANITSAGRADAVIKAKHIPRTQYIHQVMAAGCMVCSAM